MARDIHRTATEDGADALAAIEAAQRELSNLNGHVRRLLGRTEDVPGIALQAARSERIASAELLRAQDHLRSLVRRSEDSDRLLPRQPTCPAG